ncbi:MAG: DNA topoisomerase IB, partial [Burkholderiaceae bacterium]
MSQSSTLEKPAAKAARKVRARATKGAGKATAGALRKAAEVFHVEPVRLVYVSDTSPGIRRFRKGKDFTYRDPEGKALKAAAELARIRSLAIPPAYEDVWICPLADGHLQATGRDARGRKQYRYHAQWSEERGAGKFDRLQAFGRALPAIRRKVARDLRAPRAGEPVSREMVLATIVRLLDTTFLRVGNESYARENGSFGLTTLRNPHAGVSGDTLRLKFRGKSGVVHEARVRDPRIARIVRRCQQLPGQELFSWE